MTEMKQEDRVPFLGGLKVQAMGLPPDAQVLVSSVSQRATPTTLRSRERVPFCLLYRWVPFLVGPLSTFDYAGRCRGSHPRGLRRFNSVAGVPPLLLDLERLFILNEHPQRILFYNSRASKCMGPA